MRRLSIAWEDIYAASLKFLQSLTPQQTYKTVVKEAVRLLNADEGTIILSKNKKLVRAYASFTAITKHEVTPHGRTYNALKTGIPKVYLIRNEKDIQPEIYKFGFQSIIFIPFSYRIKAKGVLNIFIRQRVKILKNETFKLRLFGTMISEALYKAEQFEKAENAIKARDHFIALASHELKNPLTSILMNAQLIKKICSEEKKPDTRIIDSLVTQALWLSKLVDETLNVRNLKKVTLGPYKDAVSLLEVIHLAVTSFEASYPSFTVVIRKDTSDAFVNADFYKLLQVFVNILNNAARYSSESKIISISVETSRMNIITKITDQGIGITKKDLPKIFDGYYQGGKKEQKGFGLGLFLVKQIIESMNGEVSIKSKEKLGTTVCISLPLSDRL